jgi:hypothetical protein
MSSSSSNRIGVLAVANRLHSVLGIKVLEIRYSAASHHSTHATTHATHATHGTTLLCDRGSRLRCLFQERQQIGTLSIILDAIERHFIAGHEMLRVFNPLVERLVVPSDVR